MGREEEGFLAWEDLQALPVIHPFWGGWGRSPTSLRKGQASCLGGPCRWEALGSEPGPSCAGSPTNGSGRGQTCRKAWLHTGWHTRPRGVGEEEGVLPRTLHKEHAEPPRVRRSCLLCSPHPPRPTHKLSPPYGRTTVLHTRK